MKKKLTIWLLLLCIGCINSNLAILAAENPSKDIKTEQLKQETNDSANTPKNKIKITIPSGTPVKIETSKEINADDVKVGDRVEFVTASPVTADGYVVITNGTPAVGKVVNKRNNFICGRPGSITVGEFKVHNVNGDTVFLNGDLYRMGANRYWVNVGWVFWICALWIFFKGEDGKIPPGAFVVTHTINESTVEVNKEAFNQL